MIQASCPTCQRELRGDSLAQLPQFPFCSKRCKLIDLGRWFDERYRVPDEESCEEDAPSPETNVP